jgi:hypothetical protein
MSDPVAQADANASRAFFVQMLTRDITLEDCILDLLDNSVDGAWTSLGHVAPTLDEAVKMDAFRIEIVATPTTFRLSDNCGGMTRSRAENHAFTFGRKSGDNELGDDYRIGVYGIGMKRAMFKLGEKIRISSTYTNEQGEPEAFCVPIEVPTWMADKNTDWRFDIYADDPGAHFGVEIEVTDLTKGTKASFENPSFQENLRRTIARDYALHLARGLSIELNGEEVEPWQITLLQGADFEPLRKKWEIEADGGTVTVELLAGAAALPVDDEGPDEEDTGEQRFGWYVACNGRIVLAADKTAVSVWALDGFPIWHRQYRGFVGLLLFTSSHTELLPLTTTKRSVDLSSDIYRQCRPEMRAATRAWITYTNARKSDREKAKAAEAAAKPVSIFFVPQRAKISTPTMPAKTRVSTTSIQYHMPTKRIKALAAKFGNVNMPATQVGTKTFEFAYQDMVGDD